MDDPFPSSLPGYQSPRVYDPTLSDGMGDAGFGFYDSTEGFGSPHAVFGEDVSGNNTYASTSLKPSTQNNHARSSLAAPQWTNSPESSSGSDSSHQHKRASSSDSSAVGDLHMKDAPTVHGIMIGADNVDDEMSNKVMESHFDFDSAASSPIPHGIDTRASLRISSGTRMPFRPAMQERPANPYVSAPGVPSGSPELAMPPRLIKNEPGNWDGTQDGQPQAFSPRNFVLDKAPGPTDWSSPTVSSNYDGSFLAQQPSMPFTPSAFSHASPSPMNAAAYPSPIPTLHVAALPLKSRVETQSNVKLTLDPLPAHITKLHLQPYTISKSKLMAKPTLESAPDMYELHTTLVCSSAMQSPDKYSRALARAASLYTPPEKPEGRRSSAGDAGSSEEDENKPLNGGPVNICLGCIERERKRAARKKTKNIEEEELWLKDEGKRIVVFNTHEVKEWQPPSNAKTTDGNNRNLPAGVEQTSFSANAMQVDIPMRIACYCRHHEEKIGFRVIFTIRDHQNNFVAQTMSNSIIITDDHKTHPNPNPLPHAQFVYPENPQGPVPAMFPQPQFTSGPVNTANIGPASFTRNAFSTTDLQSMQHQYGSTQLTSPRPFAMPVESSQTTSSTMTPRNLSRPASPSVPSGQQNKRRKASGSSRIRSDLVMTKMSSGSVISPTPATTPANPISPSFAGNGMSTPAFSTNFTVQGMPLPSATPQYNTNPSTPNTTDGGFLANVASFQRSQSLENLQQFQDVLSAPTSVHHSRAPSPPSVSRINELSPNGAAHQALGAGPNHAQLLTSSLQFVNGSGNRQSIQSAQSIQDNAVIHELTPAEGSTAGGYKVTCLGSGFKQGMRVMFGTAAATTTTFWGETTLVCLVPRAACAGIVTITLVGVQGHIISSASNRPVLFRYIDEEESELMKQMFAVVNHSPHFPGTADMDDFMHYVFSYKGKSSSASSPNQGSGGHRQAAGLDYSARPEDVEVGMMKCLEYLDQDESPRKANLNYRGSNGQCMLHLCASLGYYRVAAGLLARGAHPDLRDNNGMSPMHVASLHGHVRIIRKLRAMGGDPTLRSLNGFTPADMATSLEAREASSALDRHVRSRSDAATPVTNMSRSGSAFSHASSMDGRPVFAPRAAATPAEDIDPYHMSRMTPAQLRALSRRNSMSAGETGVIAGNDKKLSTNASEFATQSALAAWRDQLSAQIQQFQQTVHRALPLMPNLPDYQGYPVVRRISSLVPQRGFHAPGDRSDSEGAKETDYNWWELLTGPSSSPPAYEDIYPTKSQGRSEDKKTALLTAAGEAVLDQRCTVMFDQSETSTDMETVQIGSKGLTQEERDRLREAHARKMKKLRSDRNLFFIWIPLLVLVVFAMLKDRAPQLMYTARSIYSHLHDRLRGRVQEVI